MAQHSIQVSEFAYQRLLHHAARLHTTPEQIVEQLLTGDAIVQYIEDPDLPQEPPHTPEGDAEALAAVERLSTLFGNMPVDDLEEFLNDPMIRLENAGL